MSKEIVDLLKKYANYVKEINLNDTLETNIKHIWIPVRYNARIDVLTNLLHTMNPYLALIFVSKKEDISLVYNHLANLGFNVSKLSGDLNIRERKRIIKDILDLKYQYVITSDILARGIDFSGVSHVISYDLPYDYEFYIHRAGRTGRMNRDGLCFALYDHLDDNYLNIAYELLPEDIFDGEELNNVEILYKRELKYGDIVKSYLYKDNDVYTIVMKSEDDSILHSIVKLY